MLTLKYHIYVLLLSIILCNILESFNDEPFNNEYCPHWDIPTGAGFILFILVEAAYWIFFI